MMAASLTFPVALFAFATWTADAGQFETALINIAVNARDAMHGAGRLTIVVRATDALGEFGYVTVLKSNATDALTELARQAARYDVVFSDVVMPGMTGIEMAQQIRKLYADLPVVLTSGYSHALAENGTFGFELLQKPYSVEQLSRVLNKHGRHPEAPSVIPGRAKS
ncbi:MAG: hybrid sensor histidine kinase/response regulator [Tardiphaga sp.]|nr:hybrid sensor histidine kinase/response regulator [Tardiphaga sp.]